MSKRLLSVFTVPGAVALALVLCVVLGGCGQAGTPVIDARAEMLMVTPATGPVTHIQVRNTGGAVFRGRLEVDFPQGWKMNRTSAAIQVVPGDTVRVPFAIEKGVNSPNNEYWVRMRAVGEAGGAPLFQREQRIVCASAPYLDIQVDGKIDDWKEAIPVSWTVDPLKNRTYQPETVVRTGWTKRKFHILVAVQSKGRGKEDQAIDVQFALASRDLAAPARPGDPAGRHEFLLTRTQEGAKCLVLARPDEPVRAEAADVSKLAPAQAEVAGWHKDEWYYYECSIPVRQLTPIAPEPGREFFLSVLVHDRAWGLRDWARAAGLWPDTCNYPGWTRWKDDGQPASGRHEFGPDQPALDSRVEWGFCSSAQ